jgi:DNA-binding SARP family transcriptional activator
VPASLAAQAVKIVGLQQRITVDELVELLWEDAEPGVGARRLRNVLWRIRSSCGELLQRDGNVVRLAPGAVTDVEWFRGQAEEALDPTANPAEAGRKARVAADGYRGELLPADRYADWATGTRESVARTYLRLLDLLVDEAVAEGRGGEAVDLLGSLAAADPYDERHFVRMAEIHLELGNRGRALDALGKAERVLEDLGVAPSSPVEHLRERLGRS